jgi:hypothetical protein
LVLLDALALRWLLVVRRRISYEAALERHRAASEAAQSEPREPAAARPRSCNSRSPRWTSRHSATTPAALIRFSLGFVAVIGLVLIWADTLPALRVLRGSRALAQDGVSGRRGAATARHLLHLGLALLFAAGTWVLLRRLPALLEIMLLRRYALSAADRYAVTALTSYVIGAVGILLVLGTLGASWTQLQWMAAALSVGIGFGLQEIVANFISGLIILFERPDPRRRHGHGGRHRRCRHQDPHPRHHHPQLRPQGAAGAEQGVHHRPAAELVAVRPGHAHPAGGRRRLRQRRGRASAIMKRIAEGTSMSSTTRRRSSPSTPSATTR